MNYDIEKVKKAYFDSFSGMISVKPLRLIRSKSYSVKYLRVRVDFVAGETVMIEEIPEEFETI